MTSNLPRRQLTIALAALATLGFLAVYQFDTSVNMVASIVQQANFISDRPPSNWFLKIDDPKSGFDEKQLAIGLNVTSASVSKTPATEAVCKFPQLLADDPLIKPYLKDYGPMRCVEEKNWVYTTGDGRFYIDSGAVERHGKINCTYSRIDRKNEYEFVETQLGWYANGTSLSGYSFRAQCWAADGKGYDNIHASVPYPHGPIGERIKNSSDRLSKRPLDLNVLIYLMDSVSRINFVRKLPKFYSFLTETMQAHVMEGFNVVGDGTPWAVIPMLTGHFQTELPEARKRFVNASYVDGWPFLFKNYTAAGYVTSYAEEQPWFSAFTYKLKGFDQAPVDHYLRTMLIAVESYKAKHYPSCLGDTPRSILWCNYWRELQTMYRPLGGRQFSMMFSAEQSHDDYNTVQTLDEHWTRSFGELYRQNFLNDTLLIVMGDHGRRFGPVRQTQTGKLEEKLPFLAVVTPPWFRKRFPLSEANLRKNRHRLVTAFDLHATLAHVLDFQEDGGRGNLKERGLSLFREIPAERTCAHAHIKAHFCSCLDWIEVENMTDPIVLAAAQRVIDNFNRQAKEVAGKCAELKLGRMISARLLRPNEQLMAFKESLDFDNYTPNLTADKELAAVIYQIRFVTVPGGGDWEASLTYYLQQNEFSMSHDDVSRLNSYHEQARCVIDTHQHLRTFCYCL